MKGRKRRKVEVEPVPEGVGGAGFGGAFEVPPRLRARVLYANPVCLLASKGVAPQAPPPAEAAAGADTTAPACPDPQTPFVNLMTISWLTCIDNHGVFFASMNDKRGTAQILGFDGGYEGKRFTLNVPTAGCETLLRRVGGESALDGVDKIASLGLSLCPAGRWGDVAAAGPGSGSSSSSNTAAGIDHPCLDHPLVVAHLECEVLSGRHEHAHHLLTCRIHSAFVRERYWRGDVFKPSPGLPPFLTFYGSALFGVALPAEALPGVASAAEVKATEKEDVGGEKEGKTSAAPAPAGAGPAL